MQARLDRMPDAMGVRRQTVEHPFATLKSWMGSIRFLTRTVERLFAYFDQLLRERGYLAMGDPRAIAA